jgi:hypothetical protein
LKILHGQQQVPACAAPRSLEHIIDEEDFLKSKPIISKKQKKKKKTQMILKSEKELYPIVFCWSRTSKTQN